MTNIVISNLPFLGANNRDVISFVEFMLNSFGITSKTVTVEEYEEKNDNITGLCIDVSEDEYLILVKDQNITNLFVTISHEMIHVKQYVKENLGWCLDNHKELSYANTWWEKEAFGDAAKYVEDYCLHIIKNK